MGLDVYLHVQGVKPPDAKWRKMRDVWNSCLEAGISIPDEVFDFFGEEGPCEDGVVVDLLEMGVLRSRGDDSKNNACVVRKIDEDHQQGYVIDVTKIPEDVKVLRIYNYLSY